MLRHPSLVKFQGIFTAADKRVVLVTEPVSPLLTIVDSMTVEEVTAGQYYARLATRLDYSTLYILLSALLHALMHKITRSTLFSFSHSHAPGHYYITHAHTHTPRSHSPLRWKLSSRPFWLYRNLLHLVRFGFSPRTRRRLSQQRRSQFYFCRLRRWRLEAGSLGSSQDLRCVTFTLLEIG